MATWIDPAFRTLHDPMPLKTLLSGIRELPVAWRQRAAEHLCEGQKGKEPRFERLMRRAFKEAKADGDMSEEIILQALIIHELDAYVLRPSSVDSWHGVPAFVWQHGAPYFDARASIADGCLRLARERFPEGSIERDVANSPLYVDRRQADQLLLGKPPSEAVLRREAKSIIKEAYEKNPGAARPITRAVFYRAMRYRVVGCTIAMAKRIWRDHAPKELRKPGRSPSPTRKV